MQGYRFLTLSLVLILSAACSNLPKEHKVITAKEGIISIPVSEVNDGKVHFFTYKKSGKRINFFVRTDGTGKLSAYFDACYICYKKKKATMKKVQTLFATNASLSSGFQTRHGKQDCSPIMFKSKLENNNLTIKTEDIEKGSKLF